MRICFDQGTPAPLRQALQGHSVSTAFELGWARLANGALLKAVEDAGFELFVTTDQNLQYQQNLAARRVRVVILTTTSWPRIRVALEKVVQAIDGPDNVGIVVVEIP